MTGPPDYSRCICHHYATGAEGEDGEREPVEGCPIHREQDAPPTSPLAPDETPF